MRKKVSPLIVKKQRFYRQFNSSNKSKVSNCYLDRHLQNVPIFYTIPTTREKELQQAGKSQGTTSKIKADNDHKKEFDIEIKNKAIARLMSKLLKEKLKVS